MNTKEQRSLIYSCLMGDGGLNRFTTKSKGTRYSSLTICHSENQYDYLYYKTDLLNKCTVISKGGNIKDKLTVYKGKKFKQKTVTFTDVNYFSIIGNRFYIGNKRSVKNILKYVYTDLSLAILFMDDGGIYRRKKKHKDGTQYYLKPSGVLNTQAFSYEDNILIKEWLLSTYGIESSVQKHKSDYYIIWLNKDNMYKVWCIIRKYVKLIPSMTDKFNLCVNFYGLE